MKRIDIKSKLLAATILIALNGCVAYYPQPVDIPLIKEKGDIRYDFGAFIIPNINRTEKTESQLITEMGFNATFSAGLTDLLAVQAYTSFDGLARVHLQGALGLYKGFDSKTVIEMYGGLGYGNIFFDRNNSNNGGYLLPFMQYNIGKTDFRNSNTDFGLGLKGGYLKTNNVNDYSETIHQKNGWMVEPSLFFRLGGQRTKYSMKVNYLWTKTIIDDYYFPLSVSMGVNLHFGNPSKKKH